LHCGEIADGLGPLTSERDATYPLLRILTNDQGAIVSDSIEQLVSLVDSEDPYAVPPAELEPLWIDAINTRLQECRPQIKLLDQLAERAGVDEIRALDDVVPLLFAHTAYKSYPESFMDTGRWDRMNLWLSTLSKRPLPDVDVSGVEDVDDWMAALHAADQFVFSTSGTSGKNSFLNQSAFDVDFSNRAQLPPFIEPNSRPIFILGPSKAPNRASAAFNNLGSKLGRPGDVHYLVDGEMRMTELSAMARMRRKVIDGSASPSEIAEFESSMAFRREMGETLLAEMIDKILEYRDQPSVLIGMSPQIYQIVEAARARGLDKGCFHPETVVLTGGGSKGIDVPADYIQQIVEFMDLDLDRFIQGYGMQEVSAGGKMNGWTRYEFPAWSIPLVLDDRGERLLSPREGEVTGRMAVFDVSIDGRWGGIISGDQVTMDYGAGANDLPAVTSIARYSELAGGDDKLTCSGTMDSFVRGMVE